VTERAAFVNQAREDGGGGGMRRMTVVWCALASASALVVAIDAEGPSARARAEQTSPGAGPIVVLETAKGVIEFETYPEEAPKTVAHILALVRRGFYNGLRFHRAEPNFVVQVGDPQTRNMTLVDYWGRGNSGKPIGVAEITKKRTHIRGAVAMGHSGSAKDADSQFYITLRNAPELNGKHAVFGRVIRGLDVAAKLQKADLLKKASVKE
jgi:cyclophilin family peptidyl-prolyl cis-trans isomerase